MPGYKTLSKFNHVPFACINPSPKKLRPKEAYVQPELEVDTEQLKLKPIIRE